MRQQRADLIPILGRQDISSEQLRQAAASLRQSGQVLPARRLLEELYTRELDANNLDVSNFLGLAEVKLESGDASAGVALLRRMALVAGEPFETLTPAAELLAKFGRKDGSDRVLGGSREGSALGLSVPGPCGKPAERCRQVANTGGQPSGADTRVRAEAASALPAGDSGESGVRRTRPPCFCGQRESGRGRQALPLSSAVTRGRGQGTDVGARIRLLRNAIAVEPVPIAPRVELFRAYFDANQFDNAVAVFRGSNVPEDMSLRSTLWRDTDGKELESSEILKRLEDTSPC